MIIVIRNLKVSQPYLLILLIIRLLQQEDMWMKHTFQTAMHQEMDLNRVSFMLLVSSLI